MDWVSWVEAFAWWAVALDCIGFNLVAWVGQEWYERKFGKYSRLFPVTKPFGIFYVALVLWLGSALLRAEIPIFGG